MTNINNESNLFADSIRGVLFYSDGASLYEYEFNSGNAVVLFSQKEAIETKNKVSNVIYPNYLKSSNRIAFIGYGGPLSTFHVYESDLEMKLWTDNIKLEGIKQLFVSPDGDKIAFGRLKTDMVNGKNVLPKEYKYELLVVSYNPGAGEPEILVSDNYSGYGCLWQTKDVLLYRDRSSNTVRYDLRTGENKEVLREFTPVGVSNDGKMLLCAKKNTIFVIESDSYKSVMKIALKGYNSSICVISPDKRYFIFSKIRPFEFPVTSETKDIWIYDLKTNNERLLIRGGGSIFGGFWIE